MRRILKTPSNQSISNSLLIDYINRFYINDVDARIQLFDLKKKYSFQTTPGVDRYNMPLYTVQVEGNVGDDQSSIYYYPVYQGFTDSCYVNGINMPLQTQKGPFFNAYPNWVQNLVAVGTGDGGSFYTLQVPLLGPPAPQNPPFNALIRGHVDIAGVINYAKANSQSTPLDPPLVSSFDTNIPVTSVDAAVWITTIDGNGNNVVMTDSGQFFSSNVNLGLLMNPGKPPLGNTQASGGYLNNFTITGITQATQAVITVVNDLNVGETVQITGVVGMTELNGNSYLVVAATATTLTIDVDSTLFTPYVSDGVLSSFKNYVNYMTGEIVVNFPVNIPEGNNINVQCYFFQGGIPRSMLFYDNVITLRAPPARQYLIELDGYLSPAAYLTTSDAIQFGYMSEYIARGAARKILSDTGDIEQFQFYEPLFREQEILVWKRSQRQFTSTRTQTIYSQGVNNGNMFNNGFGQMI